MNILGLGLVFRGGRGIPALRAALSTPFSPAAPAPAAMPVCRVAAETLQDKTVLARLRRADRFSRLAALAAWDAVADSAIECPDRTRIGLILTTAFGPHVTTFRFLDDILQFGDAAVSPTTFSHSVHTAAASYISTLLDIRGPSATLADFHFSFQQGLQLARAWLQEDICDHVLLGAADECGPAMEYIFSRRMTPPANGLIRPLAFQPGRAIAGEGSAFFVLSRTASPHPYAGISDMSMGSTGDSLPSSAVRFLDAAGLLPNEAEYLKLTANVGALAAYSPLFGSSLSGSAFTFAVAALALRDQVRHPCPVADNPHGLPLLNPADQTPVDSICCARIDCYNRTCFVQLRQPEPRE